MGDIAESELEQRTCPRCHTTQPATNYRTTRYGTYPLCRQCEHDTTPTTETR